MNKAILFCLLVLVMFSTTACWFEIEEFFLFGGPQKSWQDQAIESRDFTKCEKASMPDVCRMAYAKQYKDRNACMEMSSMNLQTRCIMEAGIIN